MSRLRDRTRGWYRARGKRILDVTVSATVLTVASPLLATAVVAIKATSRGPTLFIQDRVGARGQTFPLLKLRTMTHVPRTPDGEILPGNPEVTRVGALLRRTKLDELPQLVNVLRGEMSLVGPRPFLPAMLADLDSHGERRLEVRPGMTGLAQTRGNIHLTWPERWRYDARYVSQVSLRTDLRILARTVGVVVLGEDRWIAPPPPDAAP